MKTLFGGVALLACLIAAAGCSNTESGSPPAVSAASLPQNQPAPVLASASNVTGNQTSNATGNQTSNITKPPPDLAPTPQLPGYILSINNIWMAGTTLISTGGNISLSVAPGINGTYPAGTAVKITAAPNLGWQVVGWTGTDGDTSNTTSKTVTMNSNKSVVITFKKMSSALFILNPTPGEAGNITPPPGTYLQKIGAVVNITATPIFGWQIDHWEGTDNDRSLSPNNTVSMNSDRTIAVFFKRIYHTLTVAVPNITEGGTLSPEPGKYTQARGDIVSLVAYPAPGWEIDHWEGTDNDYTNSTVNTINVTSDKTVTVVYKRSTFTLTVVTPEPAATGAISPVPGIHYRTKYGVVTLNASPIYGWEVDHWIGTDDDLSRSLTNTVTMTSNKTVGVVYKKTTFRLTILPPSPSNGCTILPAPGSLVFDRDSVVRLDAVPTMGWEVDHWTGTDNDASTSRSNTINMTTDKTVSVAFRQTNQSSPVLLSTLGGDINTGYFHVDSSPWILRFSGNWTGPMIVTANGSTVVSQSIVSGQQYETYVYGQTGDLYFHVVSAPPNGACSLTVIDHPNEVFTLPAYTFSFSGKGLVNTSPFPAGSSPWRLEFSTDWKGMFSISANGVSIFSYEVEAGTVYETYIYDIKGMIHLTITSATPTGTWSIRIFEMPP